MRVGWLFALLLAMCCGCAASSVDPSGSAEPSQLSRTLSQNYWGHSDGIFRGRYSAVLQGAAQVFSFQGILVVDTCQHQARLVALSELGMRLFDITVASDGTTVHTALPHFGLSRIRNRVATAVRRTLLSYLPGLRDEVTENDEILLSRCLDRQCLISGFDAGTGVLLYKEFDDGTTVWHAAFSEYRDCGGFRVPLRLAYADSHQDFTLTMAWAPEKG